MFYSIHVFISTIKKCLLALYSKNLRTIDDVSCWLWIPSMYPSEIKANWSLEDYQTRGFEMKTVILQMYIVLSKFKQVMSSKNDRLLVIKVYRVLAILLSSTIKRIETMQFPKVTWCGVVFHKNEELKNQCRLLAMIFKHNTCIKERTLKRNTLCKTRIRKPISIKKK